MIPFPRDASAPTVIATSGGYFDLAAPRPEDVSLSDIALALSRINRFTGHGRGVVSVARHSVNCYREATARDWSDDDRRLALMHDAAEAYVGDVASPLKAMLPQFKRIEAAVWRAVALRFGLPVTGLHSIKEIDNLALITEARDLFPAHERWPGFPDPGFSFLEDFHLSRVIPDRDAFMFCAAEAGIA